ncbi:Aminodeoxyfutalosine deaminase [Thalassoglobus neptunius]|uniref:Aminodeoxyfutalosine deaminase n=1 Tax=Thalassoglobus neptunius TaxID=1938619 RepID=A0A5C5WJ10_9PLAN|nr:amidohydrolase family protein [Thalassoglobus neptunius]TWT50001.1 Aminodeoxyfutalosine deaminase [Thalassoglobus neptunius]
MKRYRCRWFYPGDSPPLSDISFTISGQQIVAIEAGDAEAIDLGNVAVIPGLINTHTHLEFSSLQKPLEPLRSFCDWIREVIRWKISQPERNHPAISQGLAESIHSGSTLVGEIATRDWRTERDWSEVDFPQQVVMFREFLGLDPSSISASLDLAAEFLSAESPQPCQPAISPHAPYSTHPELIAQLAQLAQAHDVPLAFHLAESPEEIELLRNGTGPFKKMLSDLNIDTGTLFESRQGPIDYLKLIDVSSPVLVIHGNNLTGEELEFLSKRENFSIVYCPRTHAAMQTGQHRWQQMLEHGINVALGTDSRASNPDLSVFKELAFVHSSTPNVPASRLLRLATVNAAQALGQQNSGRLAAGAIASLCVVPLTENSQSDPERHLFDNPNARLGVMQSGEWIVPVK